MPSARKVNQKIKLIKPKKVLSTLLGPHLSLEGLLSDRAHWWHGSAPVQPLSSQDVATAVTFAARHGLRQLSGTNDRIVG